MSRWLSRPRSALAAERGAPGATVTSGRRAWAALLVLVFPGRGLAQPVLAVPGDHPSIQAAVDAAPSGGIVEVHAGSYRERIRITKPVTLRSAAGQAVVVEAPGDAPAVEIGRASCRERV